MSGIVVIMLADMVADFCGPVRRARRGTGQRADIFWGLDAL